ncbi:DUF6510 family protein [Kineococcus sp. SYSU DK003]|uniref:DUF6510 family protein n=1 Tax=Kineococcus sp. SYSU DK003 TaxID=3383124 RepID=UPI003D7E238F
MLDGNAVAGVLAEIFDRDMTDALLRCNGCGVTGSVAGASVVVNDVGSVVRCRSCQAVLLTVVDDGEHRWLGTPGLRVLGVSVRR